MFLSPFWFQEPFYRTFHDCVAPTKFQLIWQNGFREDFVLLDNHKQELPMAAIEI
jgi:hypothetical protein